MNVTRADRRLLEAIVLDRSAPQKHAWRSDRHREKKPTGPVECWRKRRE